MRTKFIAPKVASEVATFRATKLPSISLSVTSLKNDNYCLIVGNKIQSLGLQVRLAQFAARTPRDEFPQLRQEFIPRTPY